jgi:hypothetical protein
MPGGVWNGSGGGGGSKSVNPDADDDAAAADDDDDDAVPGGQMCKHCDAWQGLRTKHCHDCGRCVRRFDHHCFWVGTCVGEKNHARFVCYLASQNALILWAFHIASSGVRYRPTAREMLDDNAGAVMMCVALLLFILFVGSLLGEATSLCSMCDTVRRSACYFVSPSRRSDLLRTAWISLSRHYASPALVHPDVSVRGPATPDRHGIYERDDF